MEAIKVPDMIDAPEHYTQYKIEPLAFIHANNLDFLTGNVIKYLLRWKKKDGIQDLKKARSYLDRMIDKAEEEAGIPKPGQIVEVHPAWRPY